MNQHLVSVVIPAYNAGRFIEASVESALSQKHSNLEVVVIDDGSTDDTVERLRRFQDRRLRLIAKDHGGLAAALNTGVGAARGAYIGFLDADDLWLGDKLARHMEFLELHPGVDVTFSWSGLIDECDRKLPLHSRRWRGAISYSQLLADFVILTMSAVVMRRSALDQAGLFNPKLLRCIDSEFFLRVTLLRPHNTWAIPEQLTLYRRQSTQRTRNWRAMKDAWNEVLESMRKLAPADTAAVERIASSNMHRYYAWLTYENGDFAAASRLVRQGFRISPGSFLKDSRNWKVAAACVAGLVLPKRVHLGLERLVGFHRPAPGAAASEAVGK